MPSLPHAVFEFAPLREVRPAGWIKNFLRTQAAGITGHPEVHGYPYGIKFWGSASDDSAGSYAAWWPYEQTAYWLDGALKCGYLSGDEALYRRALEEVDYAFQHAAPDGFIGPASLRDKDRWPHAVFFRAALAQYEISGNHDYIDALACHYRAMPHPMLGDRDVTGVEALVYLFAETGEKTFLSMAEDLYARFNARFPDHDCSLQNLSAEKKASEHGVTFNELAKLAAILYSATGKRTYLDPVVHGYNKVDRDQRLADGLHSCSEHLRGRDPLDSHETCDITDHTWALYYLLQATGDVKYADTIEKIIFNALPGAITKDFKALQYFSCPNQVIATHNSNHNLFLRGFNWMSYRPDHEVQCCPGNVHRAMPNYVSRMWLKRRRGTNSGGADAFGAAFGSGAVFESDEIVAALYGPGSIETTLNGTPVTIEAVTDYPFEQGVEINVTPERPVHFTLTLRIPDWCRQPDLTVNGSPVNVPLIPGTFAAIEREWQPGDCVELDLPFELAIEHFPGGISIDYGPLTMSMPIPAKAVVEAGDSTNAQRQMINPAGYVPRPRGATAEFPAWELTPTGPWNYALCVDEGTLAKVAEIRWNAPSANPFDPTQPPVTIRLPARRVEGWELVRTGQVIQHANWTTKDGWKTGDRPINGDFTLTPPLPDPRTLRRFLHKEVEWIELIPYGSTLLRMTVFPQGPSK